MTETLEVEKMNNLLVHYYNVLLEYSPQFVSAILIFFVGLWIIKLLQNVITRIMVKRNVEPSIRQFSSDILVWAMRILLVVTVISRLGIETTSFVAILGSIGLAIGMSLQGSLSNFAGGILIIMFKPFEVGDNIEAQGESGKVLEIHIFTTRLLTSNNQIVYIPNGILSNGKIKNYSQQDIRRSDLIVRTKYDSDIKTVKTQLEAIVANHPKVLKAPDPDVSIHELTETTVNFSVKVWVNHSDMHQVNSDILEQSKEVVSL